MGAWQVTSAATALCADLVDTCCWDSVRQQMEARIKRTWTAQDVLRHAGSCAEECGSHYCVGPDHVLGIGEPAYPVAQLGEHGVEEVIGHPLPSKPDHLQSKARPCDLLALHRAHILIEGTSSIVGRRLVPQGHPTLLC